MPGHSGGERRRIARVIDADRPLRGDLKGAARALYPVEPDGPVIYTPPAWASGDLDGPAAPRRARRLRSPDEPGRTLPICFEPLSAPRDADRIHPMADPDEHHLWRAIAWGVAISLPWYIAVGVAASILHAKGLL